MAQQSIQITKDNLIAWIRQINDSDLLGFLEGIRESANEKDWWETLSEKQQDHIMKGIKDADEGNMITSVEFRNLLRNG